LDLYSSSGISKSDAGRQIMFKNNMKEWTEESVQRLVAMDKLAARRIADKHNAAIPKPASGEATEKSYTANQIHQQIQQGMSDARKTPEYAEEKASEPKPASGEWTAERLREYLGGYSSYELRLRAMSKLINAALAAEREKSVRDFAAKILHGDDVHKAWLTEAADAYVNGFTMPAPRSSPITDEAVNEAWSELEAELDIGYITDGKSYECGQCGGKGKTHEDGCIVPSWEKVSSLNRKMFQQLRAQLAAAQARLLATGKLLEGVDELSAAIADAKTVAYAKGAQDQHGEDMLIQKPLVDALTLVRKTLCSGGGLREATDIIDDALAKAVQP
jgi:hypothetical protein